jgi:hypothetical protein
MIYVALIPTLVAEDQCVAEKRSLKASEVERHPTLVFGGRYAIASRDLNLNLWPCRLSGLDHDDISMMASRAKQTRRTPHSSSGNINFSSPSSEAQYIPRVQGNNEYAHHNAHSNPSLPSFGSTAGVSAQERIVKSLVDKMIAKVRMHFCRHEGTLTDLWRIAYGDQMPCYSGLSMGALEVDESLTQVHEALLQLSRHCADMIVWNLCEILDKLQKACPLSLAL